MSIADKLGTGSSFSQVPRGRSARGRAKAVAQGDAPAYELVRLRLDEVSPTPLNPRRNFGSDEELTRFGEELRQAQLAACVAVTRDAYLALWPTHESRIGSAHHVLVNGERRFRSAVHVGLEALDFVVRDDLAASREQFINHLLKENLDREDFDVIERARGVKELVDVCAEKSARGARSRAAEQLGRDRSWVTNQLSLLELPEELQVMLSANTLAERDGRYLARYLREHPGLDAAALLEHLKHAKLAAAKAKEQAALREGENADDGGLLSADNKPANPDHTAADTASSPSLLSADNKLAQSPSATAPETATRTSKDSAASASASSSPVPGPRHDHAPTASTGASPGAGGQTRRLSYDEAVDVVRSLHAKVDPDVFAQGARAWMRILQEHHPDEYAALLRELLPEQ
ncbi:plasmid partitioning protein [Streptomyces sp. NPDC051207]|uniref:ParB/RepB/Spo0J family partition protein n=1 Tax=Streptomyces sp. NPDC051207 TaxID=3154641 RepID=UPI0034452A29